MLNNRFLKKLDSHLFLNEKGLYFNLEQEEHGRSKETLTKAGVRKILRDLEKGIGAHIRFTCTCGKNSADYYAHNVGKNVVVGCRTLTPRRVKVFKEWAEGK